MNDAMLIKQYTVTDDGDLIVKLKIIFTQW